MRRIKRDIVSVLIFSKDKKLFIGKKDKEKGGVYFNCWHIPGGGADKGETKEQALIRELKEEIGIDISPYNIELIDSSGKGESTKVLKDTGEKVLCEMDFYVYKVIINDKNANEIEVNLDDDLIEYQWVGIPELKDFKVTPPSEELFKKLGYLD